MALIGKWREKVQKLLGRPDAGDLITAYVFRDASFAPGSATVVCIVHERSMLPFISLKELDHAFSGYITYRQRFGNKYLGVWGQRNASRLRRFLQERGAHVSIENFKPSNIKISGGNYTHGRRRRVRKLD